MSLICDLGKPVNHAAAIQPVLIELEAKFIDEVTSRVLPALKETLIGAFDGLTITITVSKK